MVRATVAGLSPVTRASSSRVTGPERRTCSRTRAGAEPKRPRASTIIRLPPLAFCTMSSKSVGINIAAPDGALARMPAM